MPKIFLWGDSILQGYEQKLRALTCGQWEIYTSGVINGEKMEKLRDYTVPPAVQLSFAQYNVIALNAGIWDATVNPPTSAVAYGLFCWNTINNIRTATQAPIILITSTSFTGDSAGMIQQYNDTLKGGAPYFSNVSILDLHAYQQAQNLQHTSDGIHFVPAAYDLLAEQVRLGIAAKI